MDETPLAAVDFEILETIVQHRQTWPVMAAKYGVENPLPPWKTSLDALCDVLDRACSPDHQLLLPFVERRDEEDELSATRYAGLPYPESQLVSLAYSLLARGIIGEGELRERLEVVRARLES
ncbi:thiocyanate hydrolase [Mycobacterium asiaticum]|uniref:Thiocyanate hydrolase n=2 Tax=Mycobacterium asiaticum TaxID=1790 RepID=A0A1A3NMQ6_MYCAS|nr:thiocyanate hydrolase [Mycobacterium asiaticum]